MAGRGGGNGAPPIFATPTYAVPVRDQPTIPTHILPVIVFAQFAGTSLWFAGNAVAADVQRVLGLGQRAAGDLATAVQMGFIVGTLLFAVLAVADRLSPVRVILVCALAGALCNLAPVVGAVAWPSLLGFRFLTGVCLAGVYPVGMKIAADWYAQGLGRALGYLVGALVLGTAFPHLLKALGGHLPWKLILAATSALAALGGLVLVLTVPNGPHRAAPRHFSWQVMPQIFHFPEFRAAVFGYFGHMWELYAWWAFLPALLTTYNRVHPAAALGVPLWSFVAIGMGSLGCVGGGYWSLRVGSPRVAFGLLAISGGCCLLSPLLLDLPPALFLTTLLVWGFAVVGDSPQFSTLVARTAPASYVGTALTIGNCLGFALTIVSIQLLTTLQEIVSVRWWYLALAPGPAFGLWKTAQLLVPASRRGDTRT